MAEVLEDVGLCSFGCGRERRPGQRTCRACHALSMQLYRAQQRARFEQAMELLCRRGSGRRFPRPEGAGRRR